MNTSNTNLEKLHARLALEDEEEDGIIITDNEVKPTRETYVLVDLKKVLEVGPWTFEQNLVVYHQINGDVDPRLVKLNKIDKWIQVYDLLKGFQSENILMNIENFVGTFVKMDSANNTVGHSDKDYGVVYANPEKETSPAYGTWLRTPSNTEQGGDRVDTRFMEVGGRISEIADNSGGIRVIPREENQGSNNLSNKKDNTLGADNLENEGIIIDPKRRRLNNGNDVEVYDKDISIGNVLQDGPKNSREVGLVEYVQKALGFADCIAVESQSHGGGLSLLWKNKKGCHINIVDIHYIDFEVENRQIGRWRYTDEPLYKPSIAEPFDATSSVIQEEISDEDHANEKIVSKSSESKVSVKVVKATKTNSDTHELDNKNAMSTMHKLPAINHSHKACGVYNCMSCAFNLMYAYFNGKHVSSDKTTPRQHVNNKKHDRSKTASPSKARKETFVPKPKQKFVKAVYKVKCSVSEKVESIKIKNVVLPDKG
ncbi:hypothetical protein AgCh_023609 [Apium graveolens]